AARQEKAERELWLQPAAGEGPEALATEAARARLRQQAWALLRAEVAAQAQRLTSASPAEASAARQVLESLGSLPVLGGVRHPGRGGSPPGGGGPVGAGVRGGGRGAVARRSKTVATGERRRRPAGVTGFARRHPPLAFPGPRPGRRRRGRATARPRRRTAS